VPKNQDPVYKNKQKPLTERVADLLSRMTREEKIAQLCSDLPVSFVENGNVKLDEIRKKFHAGLGRITQYTTLGLISSASIAKMTNEIQHFFVDETRLGIPVLLQGENLCGYPGAGGTLFPAMINVASTFHPELAEEMARIISSETKAVGIRQALSPVLDVSRDPRWGRTYETFGEDPYLISQMGIHYVRGMQKKKTDGVIATGKHFLGYAETQGGLNMTASRIGNRELYEVFAVPFEGAIKEAGLDSVMSSYSEIDGIPAVANREIITGLLRKTMGFEGVLVSDGAAVQKLFDYQKIGKTYAEAGFLACRAGCDTEMPVGNAFRHLGEYIDSGMLTGERLDEAVCRVLTTKFEYGLFEHPYVDEEAATLSLSAETSWNLVQTITDESLILLKNDNKILPLKRGKKLAVIGPHGGSLRDPISGYTYPAYVEMFIAANKGSDDATVSFNGMADEASNSRKQNGEQAQTPFTIAVFSEQEQSRMTDMDRIYRGQYHEKTLVECLSGYTDIVYEKGCDITGNSKSGFNAAVSAVQGSDAVILTLGGNCGWFGTTGGEGKDRSTLELPGIQQKLLEAVVGVGKPVILILYGPGIFSIGWALNHVQAVIQAWLPGALGSLSLAKVLYGDSNPGGKLPVSIPRSAGHIPVFYNHHTGSGFCSSKGNMLMGAGYVDSSDTPLLPFGFGLSYTDFVLSGFSVAEKEIPTDGTIAVSCTVKNTGSVAGDEVIQLYYHFLDAWVTRPVKQLAGFKRIHLLPGELKNVHFMLNTAQLGFYNEEMEFVVSPGRLELLLGTSSENILYKEEVVLSGSIVSVAGKRVYSCPVEVTK
jgi:beta-glucosidase